MAQNSGAMAQVFMVEKDGTSTPYNNLETAVEQALAGSTIYLPTGTFLITGSPTIAGTVRANTLLINKQLRLIGAGADEGSLHATTIDGHITLTTLASGSTLEGFAMGNGRDLRIDNMSNLTVKRCKLRSFLFWSGGGNGNIFRECQLYHTYGCLTLYGSQGYFPTNNIVTELLVQNCVIGGGIHSVGYSFFTNNVITSSGTLTNVKNCTISNNVFTLAGSLLNINTSSWNQISYNLCVGTVGTTNAGENNTIAYNIVNIPLNEIFVDQVRYHLLPSCPGVNAGSDGYDMGIYGSAVPAKELRIPSNPQITDFIVSGSSDINGNLKVKIKVEAQTE